MENREERLKKYLSDYGYNDDDCSLWSVLYFTDGMDAVVESFKWADDSEHNYSGELRCVLEDYQKMVDNEN